MLHGHHYLVIDAQSTSRTSRMTTRPTGTECYSRHAASSLQATTKEQPLCYSSIMPGLRANHAMVMMSSYLRWRCAAPLTQ